jgi:glycosyltransferase involved in cell wall biosynthesis
MAPYKVALFNELNERISNLHVVFVAEKESRRDWNINYSVVNFSYDLLFKGSIDKTNSFKIALKTWNKLKELSPDSLIICDYSNIFGWIALLWGKFKNNKMVFWLASTKDDREHYFPKEPIKQFFLKHFDLHLAPGKKTKEYLEYMKVDSNKIIETGYGVENDFYLNIKDKIDHSELNSGFKSYSTKKHFLFVGRLSEEKNIFTLLEAFGNVSKNSDWGLILLGNGPLKENIKDYLNVNDLYDKVHMPGFIHQNEIANYYAFSDVFILPSISEPWGLVVNEAMLYELPVIVSNKCGCVPELVHNGYNGFTFEPADQRSLERLMRDFIDDKYNITDMGTKSLQIVLKHSPESVSENIYHSLLDYQII